VTADALFPLDTPDVALPRPLPGPAPLPVPETETERSMLDRLARHYGESINGAPKWVFATQVRTKPGYYTERIADAVAVGVWQSTKHEVRGFEVKVTRSDWLREKRAPEKCEPVKRYCDRWYLVIPSSAIIREGEVPEDWGVLVRHGAGLRELRRARKLTPEPMSHGFTVCLLRAAAQTAAARGRA
jgi:hypothetical protein